MTNLTIVLPPHWITFILGMYATWTIINIMLLCDWIHDNRRAPYYISMSMGEKLNGYIWFTTTLVIISIAWSQ